MARVRALREFDERIVILQTLAVYGELLGYLGGPSAECPDVQSQIVFNPIL